VSIVSANALKDVLLHNHGRLVALDLGSKTIGVALGDLHTKIVSPLLTINRTSLRHDLQILQKIIIDYKVGGVILGLPLNMNGTEGKRCQATRQFAKDFLDSFDMPLCLWDERLTTQTALDIIKDMNLKHYHKAQAVNPLAASALLKRYIAALLDH
jgi:putative Holliday junction resolvase